jgi:outer membrane protein assembly factor BamB
MTRAAARSRTRPRRPGRGPKLSSLCAACLFVAAARADDWPQWRGPLGNGISREAGLPERWDADRPAWRTPLPGQGASSPVVARGRVFLTSQVGRGVLRPGSHPTLGRGDEAAGERAMATPESATGAVGFVVEAFDASDGRRLWEYRLPAEGELPSVHQKHNLASPSPVADGERVYAWFGTGQLIALTVEGALVWKRHLGREYSPFVIQWGHGSSPVLYRDLLILLCDHTPASYLLALDARTGRERWKVDRGEGLRSYSTPLVVPGPQGDELVVNSSERLDAYDPATGRHLWHAEGANRLAVPVATHHDGVIYTTRGYRSGPYLALRPGGRGDVSASHVLWRVASGAPYVSSLLHYEGLLFMANDSGVVTCLDPKTGARIWQQRVGGLFTASPVAGDGKVYLANESGEVVVVAPAREPRILARNPVQGRLVASPAIADGRLYLRTDTHLLAFGARP